MGMRRYGMPVKNGPNRGSHLPVLIRVMSITSGPVLELGGGMYSTPFLHWSCYPTQRKLITYENDIGIMQFLSQFNDAPTRKFHEVRYVENYDDADLANKWSVAFVDHAPMERRIVDIARLTHAEYVVAHDADNSTRRRYHYHDIYHLFRYRWKYTGARPKTAVFSNFHDLSGFAI